MVWKNDGIRVPKLLRAEPIIFHLQLVLQIFHHIKVDRLTTLIIDNAQSLNLISMVTTILLKSFCSVFSFLHRKALGYKRVLTRHERIDKASSKNKNVSAHISMIGNRSYKSLTLVVRLINIIIRRQRIFFQSIVYTLCNGIHRVACQPFKLRTLTIVGLIV